VSSRSLAEEKELKKNYQGKSKSTESKDERPRSASRSKDHLSAIASQSYTSIVSTRAKTLHEKNHRVEHVLHSVIGGHLDSQQTKISLTTMQMQFPSMSLTA
jgi:hypothetical protein